MSEPVSEITETLALNVPSGMPLHRFVINGICVEFQAETSRNTEFVGEILKPWIVEHRTDVETAYETWRIIAWTSEKICASVFSELSRVACKSRNTVKRWRGDFEHSRVDDQKNNTIVLHRKPFKGITALNRKTMTIYCVFSEHPDISHCEHVVKYPARTEARKYGHWDCHASAVVFGETAILFLGNRRSGKTTCSLEMVSRGGKYIANDLCAISFNSSNKLVVFSFPHLIRLTSENVLHWPNIAYRALEVEKGNSDYTKGVVYFGGKYEVYAPLAVDFIGRVVGKKPFLVEKIVFPYGQVEKIEPVVHSLSPVETIARLKKQICKDPPLPDWLSISPRAPAFVHGRKLENEIQVNLSGLEYSFQFSDSRAFELLYSLL